MLIGAWWLGAWFSGYAARHGASGLLTMETNTALSLLLGGVALLLGMPSADWRRRDCRGRAEPRSMQEKATMRLSAAG
ncbi:MAG: hypothetical protein AB1505_26205 [Candidatus Latescibacterota bacterium]